MMSNYPAGQFTGNKHLCPTDNFYPVSFFFFFYFILKRIVQQLPLYLKSVQQAADAADSLPVNSCSSWRDGHVPNVNQHHAGWPTPACDPAPLSLHILALCLDCIRGLCWSMPLSQSILSSVHLTPSPCFADASWECGRCIWPSVTTTHFLLLRRRRERADTQGFFLGLPVCWMIHQTGLTRSTKRSRAFNKETQGALAMQPVRSPPVVVGVFYFF